MRRRYSDFPACLLLSVACGVGASCAGAAPDPAAAARVSPEYDPATGRLTKIAYDGNANGRFDTWAYMDGARIVRLEADENENGRIDRWEYYPATGGVPGKQPPERIERSTKDDGRVTRREFFDGATMVRVEEDTDGNGAADKWETYADGALALVALDTAGRGRPDRRLVYRADGSLDYIEADPEGTGEFRRVRP